MQPADSRASAARRRILVVDDNRSLLDSLMELLERQGYLPQPADDVCSARDLYRHERPDLVLLDCDIRGCDGLELLSDFRAERPASPVIVMTARDDRSTYVRCRQLGAESLLNKPFTMEQLIAEIQRILLAQATLTPGPLAAPLKLLAYHLPKLLGPHPQRILLRCRIEQVPQEAEPGEADHKPDKAG